MNEFDELTANYWYRQLNQYCKSVDKLIMVKGTKFKYEYRKKKISFFDAVGYVYARENNFKFVTGDKEFEKMKNVEFIKR